MSDEIAEALRDAIKARGESHAELARQTGIPQPTITRFVNGRDMRLSTASQLAAYLGLSMSPGVATARKGKK